MRIPAGPPAGVVAVALALTLGAGIATVAHSRPAAPVAVRPAALSEPVSLTPHPPAVAAASRSRTAAPVAPVGRLRALRSPDLLVTLRRTLTPGRLAALRAVKGLQASTVMDAGTVRVAGRGARVMGVEPSQFRQFTPRETATSDALWQGVARGDVASTYALARDRKLELGAPVRIRGLTVMPGRVGAVAAFGVPGVDLVMNRQQARALGVVPASAVLLTAPSRGIRGLTRDVRAALGSDVIVDVLRPQTVTPHRGKPRTYRELYIASARYCPGLSWKVLAAIGQVESGHGRNLGPSSAGALGPMQFLPSTWAFSGVDGDGDGKADIMNPFDAVPAAALYLCRAGASHGSQGLYDAVFAYNHADWYVRMVLDLAARYR